ncbi:MAG: hypothetical protein ACKVW3_05655 [Phycisphaerales bacterium]
MSRHEQEQLSPERLVEAAEAALSAAAEMAELSGGSWPYPADLMGHPDQPQCLCAFTRWEIEQACAFLVRMGMLEPRAAKS